MDKKKKGIPRLLEIAGEKRGLLIGSSIFSAISAILMLLPYIAVYFIIAELLKNAANPINVNSTQMLHWGTAALVGLVGGIVFMYISGLMSHTAAYRILYSLRVRMSEHIGKLPLGYLSNTSTGIVKKTFEQNVEKIEAFVAHQLPDMVNVFVTMIITIIMMLTLNPWLTLAAMVPLILGFLIQMKKRSGKAAEESAKKYYNALERINSSTIQYVKGVPAVKIFGRNVYSFRKFYDDMISYRDYCVEYTDQYQNTYITSKVLLNSTLTFILPVGILLMGGRSGDLSFVQTLLFFIILAPGVASPMLRFMTFASSLGDISEGVQRIDKIFAEKTICEAKNPRIPSSYDIEFDNVSFSYESEDTSTRKEALSKVSFKAKKGSCTALVGPSGSGKSTVANLIPRFWDIQKGHIRIGGIDIKEISTENLMDLVSFVFQDTFLFHDTLYENIRVGRPDATKEEIFKAAKAAQCHEFITGLEKGYDTIVGEGGTHLSGGEEQRVCVARAILKNSPILVLDEATAFSDPENEYHMQLALRELMKNKTVIMIAHRLTTIKDAENIVVMKDGTIVEADTHDVLINKDGLYKKLWNSYTVASNWGISKGGI
ncbi:ABC transporter ATP-binding protein [Clostridium botulinum]|uniref:ABC transporter ATP-binding protein n=1 Tax=Clostridium botulinum TaxID=1491 RepID=UPI000774ADF0|nr:ABC transporter ATP-binding protein [Clostridium botulinum]MBY6951122.1 ABC transporter ATP-binding protein [Clostridium botulinum]MCR1140515.1 ABC transporter ATP-binding protein/permease [Clostridium botulinum]MCR1165256.1 ABC transporter ATP-binding protein/permease [Clostridium botulinum]NEZ79504.1 ABC transporter ATP-binding protein [Clostridium botulinum]NFA15605.1 ABC transporter ATP-binding protein [Clostridium botulinum]